MRGMSHAASNRMAPERDTATHDADVSATRRAGEGMRGKAERWRLVAAAAFAAAVGAAVSAILVGWYVELEEKDLSDPAGAGADATVARRTMREPPPTATDETRAGRPRAAPADLEDVVESVEPPSDRAPAPPQEEPAYPRPEADPFAATAPPPPPEEAPALSPAPPAAPAPEEAEEEEEADALAEAAEEEAPSPAPVGAGAFLTEAPPWAASAMTPNREAGAGPFLTEPPPYAASAMMIGPNIGAEPSSAEPNVGPQANAPSWPALASVITTSALVAAAIAAGSTDGTYPSTPEQASGPAPVDFGASLRGGSLPPQAPLPSTSAWPFGTPLSSSAALPWPYSATQLP